jgi:hypothetical protein
MRSISCIRHPKTNQTCSACGRDVCAECGSWLALRFRCLDCDEQQRRWLALRRGVGRVALALPVLGILLGVGALAVARPAPRAKVASVTLAQQRLIARILPSD